MASAKRRLLHQLQHFVGNVEHIIRRCGTQRFEPSELRQIEQAFLGQIERRHGARGLGPHLQAVDGLVLELGREKRAFHVGNLVVGGVVLHREHDALHIAAHVKVFDCAVGKGGIHLFAGHLVVELLVDPFGHEPEVGQFGPVGNRVAHVHLNHITENLLLFVPHHRVVVHVHHGVALHHCHGVAYPLQVGTVEPHVRRGDYVVCCVGR